MSGLSIFMLKGQEVDVEHAGETLRITFTKVGGHNRLVFNGAMTFKIKRVPPFKKSVLPPRTPKVN